MKYMSLSLTAVTCLLVCTGDLTPQSKGLKASAEVNKERFKETVVWFEKESSIHQELESSLQPNADETAPLEVKSTDEGQSKVEIEIVDDQMTNVSHDVQDVLSLYDVIYEVKNQEHVTALVDKTYALSSAYEPTDLRVINVSYANEVTGATQTMLRDEAATAVETLFADALAEDVVLYARSGYRSYETQRQLYEAYSARDGEAKADTYSARAGHSEHQTGLAIDITADSVNRQLVTSFGETKEGIWLAEHAHQYGFILSYPEDKVELTGYQYEPWHFRYVGKEIATIIYEQNLLLRDYHMMN